MTSEIEYILGKLIENNEQGFDYTFHCYNVKTIDQTFLPALRKLVGEGFLYVSHSDRSLTIYTLNEKL